MEKAYKKDCKNKTAKQKSQKEYKNEIRKTVGFKKNIKADNPYEKKDKNKSKKSVKKPFQQFRKREFHHKSVDRDSVTDTSNRFYFISVRS